MDAPALSDPSRLEPDFSPAERDEAVGLDFFLKELERLRERALIPEGSYETAVAEARERRRAVEDRGRGRAELKAAQRLAPHDPRAAVGWAERARRSDPSRREAWELELALRERLGDRDEALALCADAAARFPGFVTPDALGRRFEARAAAGVPDAVAAARAALDRGDDARVIELCSAQLARQPGHFDATVLLAFACQRLGRLDEALEHYRTLRRLQPDNAAWARWVENVSTRLARAPRRPGAGARPAAAPPPDAVVLTPVVAAPAEPVEPAAPRLSWRVVAGEFLQDHWQKLILCLAVLLIVVGSNVGASQLLGPRLWSPVGKCVLALVYTAMFAALGVGLVRWGAARAGRIMLLTTLIVIPANFMLVGQMKLLTEPSGSRLAVLGLDAAALFLLIRVVASSLRLPRGSGLLSGALFAISAFNAASAPNSPWPWVAQFAVFLTPVVLLLGSEVWLTTRFQAVDWAGRRETTYFALALLTFACLTGLVRTGVFALRLEPTLYAVPVMLLAAGSVHAAGRLGRFEPDPRPAAWLRFGGLALSGLGFALALARPEGAVYSGSTLAAALIGLGLYAALLGKERHPAYIYFGFGALVVAYFGLYYFVHDLVASVEHAVGEALGYRRKLPPPFKAINGLVLSPALAALALYFRRSWGDARLARNCHYLGVPFAVGACVFSAFEPKAAVICLSGYAVLFALAAPVFAAPGVVYLATAALAGAAYFGSSLRPGVTPADQALLGAALGVVYWLLGAGLKARGIDASFRRPLDHAALGVSVLAVLAASYSLAATGVAALASSSTFVVVALLAVLVNRRAANPWLAYAAAVCGNVGLVLLALHAGDRFAGGLNAVQCACATGAAALAGVGVASWLRRTSGGSAVGVYRAPLEHAAFVQVALTLLLCGFHAGRLAERLGTADFAAAAVALGLAAAALAIASRVYPVVALAHLTVACGLGVWMCLFQVALGGAFAKCAAYSALASGYALLLLALERPGGPSRVGGSGPTRTSARRSRRRSTCSPAPCRGSRSRWCWPPWRWGRTGSRTDRR